jgi:hypothetical protein
MTDGKAAYVATLIGEALEPLAQAHEALSGSDAAWLDHAYDETHLRLMRLFTQMETIRRAVL